MSMLFILCLQVKLDEANDHGMEGSKTLKFREIFQSLEYSGNTRIAEKAQETEGGGSYGIVLQTTRANAQEEISNQSHFEKYFHSILSGEVFTIVLTLLELIWRPH